MGVSVGEACGYSENRSRLFLDIASTTVLWFPWICCITWIWNFAWLKARHCTRCIFSWSRLVPLSVPYIAPNCCCYYYRCKLLRCYMGDSQPVHPLQLKPFTAWVGSASPGPWSIWKYCKEGCWTLIMVRKDTPFQDWANWYHQSMSDLGSLDSWM